MVFSRWSCLILAPIGRFIANIILSISQCCNDNYDLSPHSSRIDVFLTQGVLEKGTTIVFPTFYVGCCQFITFNVINIHQSLWHIRTVAWMENNILTWRSTHSGTYSYHLHVHAVMRFSRLFSSFSWAQMCETGSCCKCKVTIYCS